MRKTIFSLIILAITLTHLQSQSNSVLQVDLITGHPINIVEPENTGEVFMNISNNENQYHSCLLKYSVRDFGGFEINTTREIELLPGRSERIEFPAQVFDQKGVHWLDYLLITESGDTIKGRNSFAIMTPVGNTYIRDNQSFKFGIAGIREYDPESFELQFRAAQLIGAAYERKYVNWSEVQPQPGTWSWEKLDREIATAAKYGLERQMNVTGTPGWAVREKYQDYSKKRNTPPRIEPWSEFIYNMAKHYQSKVHYYEIWNEPDIGFYHGTIDEYLEILKSAYRQIKKADPNLQVMSGGFASAIPRERYLEERGDLHREVVKRGQKYFDVHAFHRHSPFNRFRNEVDGPLADIRSQLKENKPIWFNETAMHSTFIGEREQARILFKKLTFGWARGAIGYTWFNMLSNPHYPASHPEHNYGMLTSEFNPKAVYVAYNELVTHLHDKQFSRQLATPEGYYAFLFENENQKVLTIWKEDESKPDLLYIPKCQNMGNVHIRETDIMGNEKYIKSYEGTFPLLISRSCKFYIIDAQGEINWEENIFGSQLVTNTTGFKLAVSDQFATYSHETKLIYPDADIIPDNHLYIREEGLPEYFEANLSYAFPDQEWYGIINIPVRLQTKVHQTDWQGRKPDFILKSSSQVTNAYEHDPSSTHLAWKGPSDLSAEGWLQYTENTMKIILSIKDDQIVSRENDQPGDYINLMLYLPGEKKLMAYKVGLTEDLTPLLENSNQLGVLPEICVQMRQDRYSYVMSFPFSNAQLETGIGYNLQIHDNDSDVVEGYIQLAPGMGVVNEPEYFPVMKLE